MLQKPFIGNWPTGQKFGENFNNYYQSEGLKGHGGQDFPMPNGTSIIAACDGEVIVTYTDIHKGEGVNVLSDATFQVDGTECRFACIYYHMMDGSLKVKVGDKVKTGQLLGLSNNTGQTTGPHLHFGIFPLVVSADGRRTELLPDNGYKGAIDPLPYLDLTPSPIIPRTLKLGSFGNDVLSLQKKLNVKPETGFFWKKTQQAVKDFQTAHSLISDGIVGPKTWAELNKLL